MNSTTAFRFVIGIALGHFTALPVLAQWATVGGKVKGISADAKEITVTVGKGVTAKEYRFRLGPRAQTTLDGVAAKAEDLAVSTSVTVTYDKRSREAVRIRARTQKLESPAGAAHDVNPKDSAASHHVNAESTPRESSPQGSSKAHPAKATMREGPVGFKMGQSIEKRNETRQFDSVPSSPRAPNPSNVAPSKPISGLKHVSRTKPVGHPT
jgi:hypothetical protein